MALLASRSSQALRVASRRVPRAVKSANVASYSLLATTRLGLTSALPRRLTTIEVHFSQIPLFLQHIFSDPFLFGFYFSAVRSWC